MAARFDAERVHLSPLEVIPNGSSKDYGAHQTGGAVNRK